MRLGALTLVSMAHPGSGVSPVINSFRAKYRAALSARAYGALGRLGPSGQQNLRQLESLLNRSSLKDINFGRSNKLLSDIISLTKNLDVSMGISLEPVLFDGKFMLITIGEKADFLKDVRQGSLKPEAPSLGISSFTTVETNGYRGLAVLPPAEIEAEIVSPKQALAKTATIEKWTDELAHKHFETISKLRKNRNDKLRAALVPAIVLGVTLKQIASLFMPLILNYPNYPGAFLFNYFNVATTLLSGALIGISSIMLKERVSKAKIDNSEIKFLNNGLGDILSDHEVTTNEIARALTNHHVSEQEYLLKILNKRNPAKAAEVQDQLVRYQQLQVGATQAELDQEEIT